MNHLLLPFKRPASIDCMFGILRLVLASFVAVSHCGVLFGGLNPGVASVVVFYMLAGYIMADQFLRYFDRPGDTWAFYRDRLMRIVPTYMLFFALAGAFIWISGYRAGYMRGPIDAATLLQNLFIVPLNFFMFTGIAHVTFIPPAWSLAAELQFYIMAPGLLRNLRAFRIAFAASACWFVVAASGLVNTDTWGYRLLPGILFIFLLGAAIRRRDGAVQWGAAATVVAALVVGWSTGHVSAPYTREELIGLVAGMAAIHGLGRLSVHRWDVRLGYLAYGVFLAQFLPIWYFKLHPIGPRGSPANVLAVLGVSFGLSWAAFWVIDRPVARWRRRHRHGRPPDRTVPRLREGEAR